MQKNQMQYLSFAYNKKYYQMMHHQRLHSLPFVSYSENHGYCLHPQSLNTIQRFNANSQCPVLSIVGKAKTGKSYLLNQLISKLQNETQCQQYFPVNDGIGSGTKGIRILPINLQGHTIIIMDMEGLGNLTSSSSNEGKLFALTLFLSSVVIYNNVGPLDLQSLQGLGVLAQIGKLIENSLNTSSKKRMESPSLVVALRDFALSLQNMQGRSITSKQYLQNALLQQSGNTGTISSKNQVKKILKDIFSNRDCLTLSLPSEELPLHLNSNLRDEFKGQIKNLTQVVRTQLGQRPKYLNGKELSPSQWINFAQDMISVINSEQKSCNWRLQSLLFQAYRRQQVSVKDKFLLASQTLLKKAQLKSQQVVNIIQALSEIQEDQLTDAAQRGMQDIAKLEKEFEQAYLTSCRQIEAMMKKQGGGQLSEYQIDYNNPKISKIKDFSQIYEVKVSKQMGFECLKNELQRSIDENMSKMKNKEQVKVEKDRFALIMEQLSLCQMQREIDDKYINFMKNLKESGTQLDSKTLEANLLRLEVVYLRRKLECSDRKHTEEKYKSAQKEERSVLKDRENQLQMTEKCKQANSNNGKLFTFCSKDVSAFNLDPQSAKKSFLVPYLTFSQNQVKLEILRTLIKQDNRGKNYVEYMLEVNLPDKKWSFNRRWKDFNELHNILSHLFTTTSLPEFTPGQLRIEDHLLGKKEIEARRERLEEYARNLLSVDQIRNSRIMQKFLKINKEYVPFL